MDEFGDIETIIEEWQVERAVRAAPDGTLTSGAFARRSRLSPKALRLYEQLGVLVPDRIDPVTGYRAYHAGQLVTARLIAALRRVDMPLAQVAVVVNADRAEAAALLAGYWDGVERRVASQRELVAHLRRRFTHGEERSDMFDKIEERDVPEQTVVTEQRHVLVPDLPGFLDTAMPRVGGIAAGPLGGMVGPPFVIYHGEVSNDSDGPVEICFPVDGEKAAATDQAVRTEAAHREAYVRLRKAQVAYPQILSAYDAVAAWIHANGRAIGGPPREVYFADFMAAGPDDEVCDVAFPVAG
jgi:DNA-binding transcriptional MerR regulator